MDKKPQVIVVGGGAAGLTAGIMAARNGAAVTILEQNEKPGRKICVTGNGRCNLTNQEMSWEKFHGQNPAFVRDILSQFSLAVSVPSIHRVTLQSVRTPAHAEKKLPFTLSPVSAGSGLRI